MGSYIDFVHWNLSPSPLLGIGYAVTEQLLQQGATVVCVARNSTELVEATTRWNERFGARRTLACAVDLSRADGRDQLFKYGGGRDEQMGSG